MLSRRLAAPLLLVALALVALAGYPVATHADDLSTLAERSQYRRTGRYDEVVRLCTAFATAWPKRVRCVEFGRTPEGRPLLALVASADGTLTAAEARARRRPVVLAQGGIHAGEIDGKDAGFLALRELLQGTAAPTVLERVTLVFVPVFNADGHERVSRSNRPNQVGPEEVGWRVTSQNLNLNRDYVKAEAPEMQAMLRLLNEWDPIVYADLHVTDGAQFEPDVSLSVAPTLAGHPTLRAAATGLRDGLLQRLAAHGSLPLDFYPSFLRSEDPASGFGVSVGPPRFSQEYWAERQRIGVLVETHSWKPYPVRVRITHQTILGILELAATHGSAWLDAARQADRDGAAMGGAPVALRYQTNDHVRPLEFRGYAYTREPSPITGGLVTRYDPSTPQIWRVPLYDEVVPAVSVEAPRGGYLVPAGYAGRVAEKLALHGIESRVLSAPLARQAVQTFRATKVTLAPTTFEGRTTVTLEGAWADEARDVPAGSLFIPIAQPRARVLMTLLEPGSEDALVAWGFFTAAFERKEYMEAYVVEDVARDMLARDPAVKAAYDQRLRDDPAFANSPAARREYFYRRHPAWDERFNLYPVYRSATVLP